MVPMHLATYAWLVFGRGFFGCTVGWIGLILVFTALPWMAALVLTTILLVRRRLPAASGRLTSAQATLHVALWTVIFIGGLAVVDFSDVETSNDTSVLNRLTGAAVGSRRWEWLFPTALLASIMLWCVMLAMASAQQSTRQKSTGLESNRDNW